MKTSNRTERRADALSKERIVEAAIGILDHAGEGALTFRSLAAHLATGSGAIYWHVADKDDLLAAAADQVIAAALTDVPTEHDGDAAHALRRIALRLFDAFSAHPWVGAQLFREPWQHAVLRILERVGGQLQALGVPESAQFDGASALMHYIFGLAGQYAAGARLHPRETRQPEIVAAVARRWAQLDPAQYPFVRKVVAQLAAHDERAQFLAGIDLILAGMGAAAR
ncbi:TetR/AcrR family transcriptional regulator C-terminal domain-containing protein [Burkholderia sp. BCCIQ04A]|uniref:TetR/AcrR family transcriptional regulator C-terminal domain-containing protein n=1 Tax=Burkholderia anthinoferrum TaxID=3090833 RepID=A0ABU5WNS6_9BURK|nr:MULTISPECIES: TetR/AcrR family transcriptional regulator C-terminal domain-containing protein [Burkholderia]MEB2504037.1 TetR/AcrR family transcriptional regulator C-terminal domain-containing protein [Burkholderia anthinoferrum]MEB2532519.1 TetR/AcrR family transcriptional regulator C-terminal domain-containing protein [Burkholderia anthinoferrum]MEB2563779.1 TetR/AcrR family transcriptional regulator C-terminal domain-containing protein [Burkholderia anthinoferrum]MEB2579993.1 TetR/AcrR fa